MGRVPNRNLAVIQIDSRRSLHVQAGYRPDELNVRMMLANNIGEPQEGVFVVVPKSIATKLADELRKAAL